MEQLSVDEALLREAASDNDVAARILDKIAPLRKQLQGDHERLLQERSRIE